MHVNFMCLAFCWAFRAIVGLLFLASGVAKFRFFGEFTNGLRAYGWIQGQAGLRRLAFLISASEALVGMGLLGSLFARAASILGLVLLAIFTSVVIAALARRNPPRKCGCMMPWITDRLGWSVVLRNLGLMLLLLPSSTPAPLSACFAGGAALLIASVALTGPGDRASTPGGGYRTTPNHSGAAAA